VAQLAGGGSAACSRTSRGAVAAPCGDTGCSCAGVLHVSCKSGAVARIVAHSLMCCPVRVAYLHYGLAKLLAEQQRTR